MTKYYLWILVCLFSVTCKAQVGKLYTADNQLSNSFVNQVFQDKDGFMWIATRNGINRYDGYQFKTYRKEDGKSQLVSNYINCIYQDSKGHLYVGSNLTIQRFDGDRFETIQLKDRNGRVVQTYIYDIRQCSNQEIVIASSGFGLFKLHDNNTAQAVAGLHPDIKYTRKLAEDKRKRLWVMTQYGGLHCLKNYRQAGRYFTGKDICNVLRDIAVDSKGNIWVATFGHGLWKFDEKKNVFEKVQAVGTLPIAKIYINKEGKVMLGCDGKGLWIYDPQHNLLTPNPYYSKDVDLSHAKVFDIVEDRNNNLWLGLLQKGVFMQPGTKSMFGYIGPKLSANNIIGSNCVMSVFMDSKKRLWVGTDKDGLYLLGPNKELIRHYQTVPSTILSICEDLQGRIWLGSYEEGFGWTTADADTFHPHNLKIGNQISVFSIARDSKGWLWIATMGQGVVALNPQTQQTINYQMKPLAESNRKVNSLINNFVNKIIISKDGRRIYVATSVGISALDRETNSWLTTFGVNCPNYGTFSRIARESDDGKLYLGTNDGLWIYDLKTQKARMVTKEDGLPDNGVATIEIDCRNNLWVGTDHGLGHLDRRTGTIASFFVDRGLQSNEFTDGTSYISADRQNIILGGTGGISWFNINDIGEHAWKATVKITALTVGNQEVSLQPGNDRFKMNYEDNSFSIHLSTLTYDDPDNIEYQYCINNDDWVSLSKGSNEISFTHLSPGTYKFRVKAMMNNMPSEEKQFTIVVRAPWYRSTWAYLVYMLLIGAAVYMYMQYRKKKEEDRIRLQEHIHAEELGEAKLRFFMNISHEIRTPMTLIIAPLLQLIKEDHDVHRRSTYETIKRNADRILSLINQIMDLRKIDKGQMSMLMRETDLVGFIQDIYSTFSYQAKTKNVTFTFDHDSDALPVWIDRSNFDKILMNMLSNAFKFCSNGGMVRINLTNDGANARIAISNDGSTIPEDKLNRIFERFYQVPALSNDRNMGTGIGLDLTRSLVELHYGEIRAYNLPDGAGCEFEVTIPLGNGHLKPEEMAGEEVVSAQSEELTMEEEELLEASEGRPDLNQQLSNRKKQHIVIAEDDDEISRYLKSELESDFTVTLCPNGAEALKVVLKEVPSLVISDIMMPEMDGNTLCTKIKSNINTNHIPVILLTAKNRDEDKLEGFETGADSYIVKPFNMDILRRVVVNLLHQRELLRNKFNGNESQEERIEAVKIDSPDEKLMERIISVINKNMSNSNLSVDMIATEVGISRVHLYRKMKELTNQAPHAFIRNTRLKQAAKLLATSNRNITEVMYACGFPNATSFSTIFKKLYGVSPREYMKQHNSKE